MNSVNNETQKPISTPPSSSVLPQSLSSPKEDVDLLECDVKSPKKSTDPSAGIKKPQNKNTTNAFMACLRKIPEYISAGCVAVINFLGSLFVGIATLFNNFFNQTSSPTSLCPTKASVQRPNLGSVTPKQSATQPTTPKNGQPTEEQRKCFIAARDFCTENKETANRIIRDYCIPLPQEIIDIDGLLGLPSNSQILQIKQIHSLEEHLSRIDYSLHPQYHQHPGIVPKDVLADYARALGKNIYVKFTNNTGTVQYGRAHNVHGYEGLTEEQYKQYIREDKAAIEIDINEWTSSDHKIHYLAEKFFSKDEMNTGDPDSYGEVLKKAIQKTCKIKQGEKGNDLACYLKDICGRLENARGSCVIYQHLHSNCIPNIPNTGGTACSIM